MNARRLAVLVALALAGCAGGKASSTPTATSLSSALATVSIPVSGMT